MEQPQEDQFLMDMQNNETLSILSTLFELQEERAYAYKLLDEGHKIYLSTAPFHDFEAYQQVVHNVTQDFKRISGSVMELERNLREQHPPLASLVSQLQCLEQRKLHLTAQLQLARQNILESSEPEAEVKSIRKEMTSVIDGINDILSELKYEAE
ncbi:C19orf60 [Cordylochernes scorpioides]|uniref:C19orf60 n=1 Tax=Cordylochernes scorpioides TaxID=51811 RepID=A0ABY6LD39_9ARAC|nr:C19orf60 [Cordylochernes scorpioides]